MPLPITVLLNKGSDPEKIKAFAQVITDAFAEAGAKAHIITFSGGKDFTARAAQEVEKAKADGRPVVAAGGDGTVNFIANLCYLHQVTLGVIPLGTFNYFARELGILPDVAKAVAVIVAGATRQVAVGVTGDHIFLNNASFGLYSMLIREREGASSRFGRLRIVAALAAARTLFRPQKLFSIRINTGDQERWYETAMVFVGNNTLQLENLGMDVAVCTKQDKLAVIIMKKTSRLEMAWMLLCGMAKALRRQDRLIEFCTDGFEMKTHRRHVDLVIDGEIIRYGGALAFHVEKNALTVMVPSEGQNDA